MALAAETDIAATHNHVVASRIVKMDADGNDTSAASAPVHTLILDGDVGVVVPQGKRLEALFGLPNDSRCVPVTRLEHVATVHALTIHKSQGSEYDHAVIVLPEQPSRIVTRELLYTGVTRARQRVTIISPRDVLEAAIRTPIRRATGLVERLG